MAKASKPKKETKKAPKQEPLEEDQQPVDFSALIQLAVNTKPMKWPKRAKKN